MEKLQFKYKKLIVERVFLVFLWEEVKLNIQILQVLHVKYKIIHHIANYCYNFLKIYFIKIIWVLIK